MRLGELSLREEGLLVRVYGMGGQVGRVACAETAIEGRLRLLLATYSVVLAHIFGVPVLLIGPWIEKKSTEVELKIVV